MRIVPHLRTLRKARMQILSMVRAGLSIHSIRAYLHQWSSWWQNTAGFWTLEELLNWFITKCWDIPLAAVAAGLLRANKATLWSSPSLMDCPGAV